MNPVVLTLSLGHFANGSLSKLAEPHWGEKFLPTQLTKICTHWKTPWWLELPVSGDVTETLPWTWSTDKKCCLWRYVFLSLWHTFIGSTPRPYLDKLLILHKVVLFGGNRERQWALSLVFVSSVPVKVWTWANCLMSSFPHWQMKMQISSLIIVKKWKYKLITYANSRYPLSTYKQTLNS